MSEPPEDATAPVTQGDRGGERKESKVPEATSNAVATQAEIDRQTEIAKNEHRKATGHATKAVQHAMNAGDALLRIKGALPHGRFTLFLKENFPQSERTARNYMTLAANRHRIADLKPASINAALLAAKELREPRKRVERSNVVKLRSEKADPPEPKTCTITLIDEDEVTDDDDSASTKAVIVTRRDDTPETESDPLGEVLELIPKLDQGQREELCRILVSRWGCTGKEDQ